MNEPVVRKNFLAVAISVLTVAQIVAPAAVAVACLYAVIVAYALPVGTYFHFLALVVGLLAFLFMRTPRTVAGQLSGGSVPLVVSVLVRWSVALAALLLVGFVTRFSQEFPRRIVLTWACLTPGVIIVVTLLLQEMLRRLLRDPANARKVVIAGCTESSRALAKRLTTRGDLCMSVVGFFDDRSGERLNVNGEVSLLGKLSDLPPFVRSHAVEVAFVALPIRHVSRVMALVDELRDTTASIYYLPDIFVFDLIQSRTAVIDGIPIISMCETPLYGHRAVAKRLTDVILTSVALLPLAPVMLLIALGVRLSSPGPVVFRQRRYGLNGEEITVYKFRTMTVVEDGPTITQATKADTRVTAFGRFLRRYSLDEMPQLINVLQGRMSLVGPRPHAVAHNEFYRKLIKGYMVRHKVLPGITGLAQVNGLRGETRTIEQMEARVRYDLEYLRSWSIELDIAILARTAIRILNDSRAF
ncbi:MAG TPA: undecaprenyl-phosphate glucose phosphotransferase [Steroidobacteraceae bacterium]|nr:undecaprenyl-phosphate glucose phosphotransferase [Steroidobacteraceae bacterium]